MYRKTIEKYFEPSEVDMLFESGTSIRAIEIYVVPFDIAIKKGEKGETEEDSRRLVYTSRYRSSEYGLGEVALKTAFDIKDDVESWYRENCALRLLRKDRGKIPVAAILFGWNNRDACREMKLLVQGADRGIRCWKKN